MQLHPDEPQPRLQPDWQPSLQTLNLEHNWLGTAVDKLVEMLEVRAALTVLDLSVLDHDETGKCAAEIVERWTRLGEALAGNRIGAAGATKLTLPPYIICVYTYICNIHTYIHINLELSTTVPHQPQLHRPRPKRLGLGLYVGAMHT